MFNQIVEMLNPSAWRQGGLKPDQLQIAVAALLAQAALMDDHFDAAERTTIERLLSTAFHLDAAQAREVLAAAERTAENSSQLYPFTRTVVERLDAEARIELIEMLWEVAYADGVLSPDEDALIRRIAGMIYVSDHDRGAARKRALQRRAVAGQGNEKTEE
jgi:uncharacterized tellurite resistance protein B-like protein